MSEDFIYKQLVNCTLHNTDMSKTISAADSAQPKMIYEFPIISDFDVNGEANPISLLGDSLAELEFAKLNNVDDKDVLADLKSEIEILRKWINALYQRQGAHSTYPENMHVRWHRDAYAAIHNNRRRIPPSGYRKIDWGFCACLSCRRGRRHLKSE